MQTFPSQNDKKNEKNPERPRVLEKTDPDEDKCINIILTLRIKQDEYGQLLC